jgi:DNA-binding NarL/FixJ family response regulator
MVRILIADDHEVIRRGLRQLIENRPGWEICGEATNGTEALARALALKPDVAVVDLSMPDTDGVALVRQIRAALPETELLIFTMHEGEELIRAVIGAGARGYVLKSDPTKEILAAIDTLARHKPFFTAKIATALREAFLKAVKLGDGKEPASLLSAREREIVQLLAEGNSNKDIANRLAISVKTVETHRAAIMRKLEVNSIVEVVHYAVRNKMILG